MQKLICNCDTGEVIIEDFTQEELKIIEEERLQAEQQAQLDLLKPTQEEVEKAERQVNLINDLTEIGVIK